MVTAHPRSRETIKRALHARLSPRMYERTVALAKALDIRLGRWSEPEIGFLRHVVGAGDTVFDVGANYGLYSFHLSSLVGARGRVYAFEPIPSVRRALEDVRRLLRLENVSVVPVGVADEIGEAVFDSPIAGCGAIVGGLSRMRGPAEETDDALAEESVAVTTLDAFAAQERIDRVSLIKCDIEGAELFAMRGAQRLLEQRPTVICEIGRDLPEQRYHVSVDELLELFAEHALDAWSWDGEHDRLVPADFSAGHDGNYVFADRRRVVRA